MNGEAHRVGYRIQGGLYSAPTGNGGVSARESTATTAMGKRRGEL